MTINEFRQQAVLSAMQGILEAKGGIIGEVDPTLLARESIRVAEAVTEHYFKKYGEP